MKRTFTCILCPNGCEVEAEYEDGQAVSVLGCGCPRGKTYVTQELLDPRRMIATSVRVVGGALPLASVRLTNAVPKNRIFDVMREMNRQVLNAPVKIGDVVVKNILGLGSDVIVTKNVDKL
jgi:CxxC motif-containing protein